MRAAWIILKIISFMLLFVVWIVVCLIGAAYLFVWAASRHLFIT